MSYSAKTTLAKGATPAAVIIGVGNLLQFVANKAGIEMEGETALTIVTGFYSAFRMLFNWLKNSRKSGF